MSEEQRFKLKNELFMTKSKTQVINLYLDKLDQLQQKENIIKEVREYIDFMYKQFEKIEDKELITNRVIDIAVLEKILKILDKGE